MDSLAGFESFLIAGGSKFSTIRNHVKNIERINRLAGGLELDKVLQFLIDIQKNGRSARYANILIDSLHAWGHYANIQALISLKYFREKPHIKATMSDEEIESFLGLPCPTCRLIGITGKKKGVEMIRKTDPKRWEKMRAFWSICAYTGMRPGEVAHLKIEDVDWGRGVFILEDTKTNEPRFVPIPPNITDLVKSHIATYVTDSFLFPSPRGGNHNGVGQVIDNVDWHYDFHRRIKRLGIRRKNLTPYSLRHSLITRLLEEDVNIFKVQKIVGHRRLDTTAQYTHLTTRDICEAIKKHPLIRRSTDPREILRSLSEIIKNFRLEKDQRFFYRLSEDGSSLRLDVAIKAP